MTLAPEATHQAARDAATKIAIATGTPLAPLAWLLRQSWKVKFVFAATLMFLAYGLYATVVDRVSDSSSVDDPAARCDARMPLGERAKCIIAQEDAAAEREKRANEIEDAELAREYAPQKAIDDEVRRQRAIVNAKPLKAAFDKRLMEVATAKPPATSPGARNESWHELSFLLLQYLRAGDHPLNQLIGIWGRDDVYQATNTTAGRTDPKGTREATAAFKMACKEPITIQNRMLCAQAITMWIDKLSFEHADRQIMLLALSDPQALR